MVSILTHAVFITKESMMDFLLFKGIKMPFNHLLIQLRHLNIFSSTLKKRNDHKIICNLEIFCPLLVHPSFKERKKERKKL